MWFHGEPIDPDHSIYRAFLQAKREEDPSERRRMFIAPYPMDEELRRRLEREAASEPGPTVMVAGGPLVPKRPPYPHDTRKLTF